MRRWLIHKKQLVSEKLEFEEDRETKEKETIKSIIGKVVEKAEFLSLLSKPKVAFRAEKDDKDDDKKLTRGASLMRAKSMAVDDVFDLKKRVLPNSERQKLVDSASTTSVLACLQTPIQVQTIKSHMTKVCYLAIRRITGFKMLLKLMEEAIAKNELHNISVFIDYFNSW